MAEAQKDSERKGVASFKGGAETVGASEEEQVVVTINAPSGRIVKVEKIDNGKRHELAHDQWSKLIGGDEVEEIETALEEAFEAGIAAMLGEEYEDDEAYEDDEERDLRRALIAGLLRRRPVQRRILQRVVVSRLLRRRLPKRARQ
jgi:hypothetical protein